MASCLPLELQQHIFQYLDPQSFYSSRKVCRWWRVAANDAVTLSSRLGQLPVEPTVTAKKLNLERVASLYNEAARVLMLGMDVKEQESANQLSLHSTPDKKITFSADGQRAASLEARQIKVYDLSPPARAVIAQRTLNDLRSAVGGGPWFKCAPTSVHELALSSDGKLLAVALERTIQIYDMEAGEDSWPVSSYISSASGHYIAALSFEHNNSLLKVELSNKGTVVYLGTPSNEIQQGLAHWQDRGGLKHAFLDSSKAVVKPLSSSGVPEVLAGFQLLRPLENGWLFAAQKRCSTTGSAQYCVGYVDVDKLDGHTSTASRTSVILAELPSSTSMCLGQEVVEDAWRETPSAHVQHPRYSLSSDNGLLAVAAPVDATSVSKGTERVFVYRLPGMRTLLTTLKTFASAAKAKEEEPEPQDPKEEEEEQYTVRRLPLCVGACSGKSIGFSFCAEEPATATYRLTATTELSSKIWTLLDG